LHARDVALIPELGVYIKGLVTGWKGAKVEARKIGATFSKHPFSSAPKVGINFFDATCATRWGYFVGATWREILDLSAPG